MQTSAVLFDKDGTLFDFQKTWGPWVAYSVDLLARGDDELAARISDAWGFDMVTGRVLPGSIVIAGDILQAAAVVAPLVPEMAPDALVDMLEETGSKAVGVEVLPLDGFLGQLAGTGLDLGIATNDSERAARAHLRRSAVEHHFSYIAGYDSGYGSKPDPGMCLAYAQKLGVPAQDIVMVGDSTHDLEAGRAAGMVCVGVLTGIADHAELDPFADVVLPDIGGLIDWLG